MSIKRIEVRNFKSFEELKIDLGKFNVIIGANASGKSNFVHIFEFLRDITSSGLDNAISMQGGVEYLRNMNIGASEPLFININCCNHLSCGQKRFPLFELIFALEFKPQDLILEPWYF